MPATTTAKPRTATRRRQRIGFRPVIFAFRGYVADSPFDLPADEQ
jgi:hypothetical protein